MSAHLPRTDELRGAIRNKGFRVKTLALHAGLEVRTLQRHFQRAIPYDTQGVDYARTNELCAAAPFRGPFQQTKSLRPSATPANQTFAATSNDTIAARHRSSRASTRPFPLVSRFDKELSHFDKSAELSSEGASGILESCASTDPKQSRLCPKAAAFWIRI